MAMLDRWTGSGPGNSFTGEYAYIWAAGGTLPVAIANSQYDLGQYEEVGNGTITDESTAGSAEWAIWNAGQHRLEISASGLYLAQANANFTGPGENQDRWAVVGSGNSLAVGPYTPAFGVVVQGFLAVDITGPNANVTFNFSSGNIGDSITYAEIYLYQLAAQV